MNENSTNNNKEQAKYPITEEEAFFSNKPYTDPEWEAYCALRDKDNEESLEYLQKNSPINIASVDQIDRSWDIPNGTKHTPEYYRKEGKPEWNLVDFPSLEPLVRALEYGKTKHGKFSYTSYIPKDILLDKLYRHIIEIHKGNFIDEETGEHHIGGVLANAMFYSYHHRYSDLIPRPVPTQSIDYETVVSKPKDISTLSKSNRKAAEYACILKLKNEGKTIEEIAKILELNERTIYRRLKNGN